MKQNPHPRWSQENLLDSRDQEKWPERHKTCMRQTSQRGAGVGPACQALGSRWPRAASPGGIFGVDSTAKVPGPHWLLGCLSREHGGRKGLQDSGGTEFLEQLYTSTVPSETLLHISNAPAWSRIPKCQPKNPSMGCISWRTGTESERGVAGSRTHSALSCCSFSQETKAHIVCF